MKNRNLKTVNLYSCYYRYLFIYLYIFFHFITIFLLQLAYSIHLLALFLLVEIISSVMNHLLCDHSDKQKGR